MRVSAFLKARAARLLLPIAAIMAFSLTGRAASSRSGLDRDLKTYETTYYTALLAHESDVAAIQDSVFRDSLSLYSVLEYAVLHNPGVEAALNRWKATTVRITQAKALPDPRLNFGEYFREVETRVGPQRQSVGLSQMFPWFGTLRPGPHPGFDFHRTRIGRHGPDGDTVVWRDDGRPDYGLLRANALQRPGRAPAQAALG